MTVIRSTRRATRGNIALLKGGSHLDGALMPPRYDDARDRLARARQNAAVASGRAAERSVVQPSASKLLTLLIWCAVRGGKR